MIIATGMIHNEGRASCFNYASRLVRGGREFELIIVDGAESATTELGYAVEQICRKAIAEQLCELNTSLGFSVGLIVLRFKLLRNLKKYSLSTIPSRITQSATTLQDDEQTGALITFPGVKDEREALAGSG